MLTVVDTYTRECLAAWADISLTGHKLAAVLDEIAAKRGYPKLITVDNCTEFYSKAMDLWAFRHQVKLDFIRPVRPMENGYIESFNGMLRDECLNGELFSDILDARQKLAAWKRDYNEERPHTSIGEPDAGRVCTPGQDHGELDRGEILNLRMVHKLGAGHGCRGLT